MPTKYTIEYTRDIEIRFAFLSAEAAKATAELLPVERARNAHLANLGKILWDAPRDGGTMGLANWAAMNAAALIAMLEPFVAEEP